MPKKRTDAPINAVETELFAALERLKEGKPNHPDLAKKAKLGKLRINASTVAKEAARARTLIGHDACAYPRVRAAIKQLEDLREPPTSFEDVNRNLRIDNQKLRNAVKVAMSQVGAVIRRMEQMDVEVERRVKEAKRIAANKHGRADPNQVAGARLLRESGSSVIRFPSPDGPIESNS